MDAPGPAASGGIGLDRTLRLGALVAGFVVGALIGLALTAGAPLLESLLLMAVLGFFSGVPLGYLSTSRPDAVRLAVLAGGGAAVGTLLTAAGVGLVLDDDLAAMAQRAALLSAVAGLTSLLFLTLGALLGRRAGSPRFRRAPSPGDEDADRPL